MLTSDILIHRCTILLKISEWSNLYQPWVNLKRDLEVAAISCGNTVISNGGGVPSKNNKSIRQFCCGNCYHKHQKNCIEPTLDMLYRKSFLVHDNQNSRGKSGINGPKHIKTTNSDHICKFGFSISCNQHGFSEASWRYKHPYAIMSSVWGRDEDIWNGKKTSSNNSLGRNFVHDKFGKFIRTIKIEYLSRRHDCGLGENNDDITSMLENFWKSKEIQFTTLSGMPVSLLQPYNHDTCIPNSEKWQLHTNLNKQ